MLSLVFYIVSCFFFLMIRRPPRSTRTDTLFPTRRSSDLRRAARRRSHPARPRRPAAAERLTAMLQSIRSEEHTSELQSLMRISYAVFCLKKKKQTQKKITINRKLESKKTKIVTINTQNQHMITTIIHTHRNTKPQK